MHIPSWQAAQFEERLSFVVRQAQLPSPLAQACLYALIGGGKRVRPRLCLASFCDGGGGDDVAVAMMWRACLALELLHGYSLIHDDLPCMDDDDLRRGMPTCHIAFGEAVALLAGDVLQSLAFEVLTASSEHFLLDERLGFLLCQRLAVSARRMVAGQMSDSLGEGVALSQEMLECIHRDKTGALICASVLMGAICAKADTDKLAQLERFGGYVGLGFQVQDDVLDVTQSTKTLGKSAGSDEKLDKSTYVKLLGVDGAMAYADDLFAKALSITDRLGADQLAQLVKTLKKRQY